MAEKSARVIESLKAEKNAKADESVIAEKSAKHCISCGKDGVLMFSCRNHGVRKLNGAIFDLDGTLLDSLNVWHEVDLDFFKKMGKAPEDDILKILQPLTLEKSAEYIYSTYNVCTSPSEIVAILLEMIEPHYYHSIQLKSGVRDFLELLKQRNVKMSVATATNKRLTRAVLERTGILSYFEAIVSCVETGTSKMQPDVYYQALDAIGTTISDTLVFEDAYLAIKTLNSAGFSSAAIFDKATEKQWEQIKGLSDIHILSFDDLGIFGKGA